MRIGLVEDSLALGQLFKEGPPLSGQEVIWYESVQEATSAILNARFYDTPFPCDMLLLDKDSEQNAVTTIQQLRLFLSSEQFPIILLSNPSTKRHRHGQEKRLAIRILNKPITPAALLAAVKAVQTEETSSNVLAAAAETA